MSREYQINIKRADDYDVSNIYSLLDNTLFSDIEPDSKVVIKPNWVKESHLYKSDWNYIISHPTIITSVLMKLTEILNEGTTIIITDGPQTDSSFKKIIEKYPTEEWLRLTEEKGINLEIIDLRDHEWINKNGVIVKRIKLDGDPRGKVEFNLSGNNSEFSDHVKSKRGYYGADYNMLETNKAHDGSTNLYSVSRSVIEADIFINIPKLKTHKKAGITCCLKNLVGINTYKNYLPHHSEGGPVENGDQYNSNNINSKYEGPIVAFFKKYFLRSVFGAKLLKPFVTFGLKIFGRTEETIRSGNWYGNDTLWRTVIDLNKVLFYGNSNGTLKNDNWINHKKYIGIVDAIYAGEGNGPMAPDKISMNKIIFGKNPVAIDAVCAELMGFDYTKIPSIKNAFDVKKYPICSFSPEDIIIIQEEKEYTLTTLPSNIKTKVEPHFGWKGHIERIKH